MSKRGRRRHDPVTEVKVTRASGRTTTKRISRDQGCLGGEVRILTPDGYKAIALIKAGDRVLSLNQETNSVVIRKVRATIECSPQTVYKVTTRRSSFKTTKHHAFLAATGGWIRANSLEPGDMLLDAHGKPYRVLRVEECAIREPVHNLRTEREHNFIVEGGLVAHNYGFLRGLRAALDEILEAAIEARLALAGRREPLTAHRSA